MLLVLTSSFIIFVSLLVLVLSLSLSLFLLCVYIYIYIYPAAKHLSPPPDSCRQAILCFPAFPMFSSTWGNPEVGGGDNFWGSYIYVCIYSVFSSTWGNPEVGGGHKCFGFLYIYIYIYMYISVDSEVSSPRPAERVASPRPAEKAAHDLIDK